MRRSNGPVVMVLGLAVVAALSGCAGAGQPTAVARQASDPPVVTPAGVAGVEIGSTRGELAREPGLRQRPGDCHARLPGYPSISPVFEDDRLVLLWAHPPVRTAEGLAVGSPVPQVRAVHPDAEELAAPPGSHRFDGLLVTLDERAYLFLHDRHEVQKLVVGYEQAVRRLFHGGAGAC